MGVDQAQLKEAKKLIAELLKEAKPHPLLVRLAWHDSGTYDKNVEEWPQRAGANGSLRFPAECAHGCNAGLVSAVELLKPIKDKVPNVSWADLMQMASALAIEDAGGPKIDMRYGREDCPKEELKAADGVLPAGAAPWPNSAISPAEHLREVFYRQGFNDQEIVALSGAHTLGRAFHNRSGLGKESTKYTSQCPAGVKTIGGSSWTKDWLKFDNEYFTHIVERSDPELLVLDTDRCLFDDAKFRPHAQRYAADQDNFFQEYAAAHKKLSENGAQWVEGSPVALEE
jgi:L-ascorbate peroxidase